MKLKQESTEPAKNLKEVITIDQARIQNHLDQVVRGTVEETLNAMLDAEADALCQAERYEHTEGRQDTRAGHYRRKLHTKAGEVRNVSVLVAVGVDQEGFREVLGVCEGAKEDEKGNTLGEQGSNLRHSG